MSKYFVVKDIKVAEIMSALLNQRYYKFYDEKLGQDIYTFERTENINKVYGNALTILDNL